MEDKNKNKNSKKRPLKTYETNAVTAADRREPESNVRVPSQADVIEAKEWGEYGKM